MASRQIRETSLSHSNGTRLTCSQSQSVLKSWPPFVGEVIEPQNGGCAPGSFKRGSRVGELVRPKFSASRISLSTNKGWLSLSTVAFGMAANDVAPFRPTIVRSGLGRFALTGTGIPESQGRFGVRGGGLQGSGNISLSETLRSAWLSSTFYSIQSGSEMRPNQRLNLTE